MKYFLSSTIIIIAAFFSTGCFTPKPPALKQADLIYKNKVDSAKADFKKSREELLESTRYYSRTKGYQALELTEAQAREYSRKTFKNDDERVDTFFEEYFRHYPGTLANQARRVLERYVEEGVITKQEFDYQRVVGTFQEDLKNLEYTRDSEIEDAARDLAYEYRRHGREKAAAGILRRR